MRMSRVLLAGVAVAGVAATTSAFTNSNTSTGLDNNVAGYGQLTVSGVNVSNIAYTPASDASQLAQVVFTVDTNTTSMAAVMTLSFDTTALTPTTTCTSASSAGVNTITCDNADVAFSAFNRTALTVTSN
jgi:hypothetical protein